MTMNRMVKDGILLIIVFITCLSVDFASSLYLSQSNVTMEQGKSLAISCRDTAGQPVTWKGPKGALNANTKPKIQDTAIGKLLIFSPTRVQDTGNYTCSLISNKNDFSVFSLLVEVPDKNADIDATETSFYEIKSTRKHTHNHKTHKNNRYPSNHITETTTEDVTDTTFETETTTKDHSKSHYHFHGHSRERYHPGSEEPLEFKDTPDVQKGREGETFTLRCDINKPYKINWLLDENKDPQGTKYKVMGDGLLIPNVSREEDNRIFTCEAVNTQIGKVVQKKIKFVVEHKPVAVTYPNPETGELPVYAQDNEVYGFIGEKVNLTCEVEAEPPPKFEWRSEKSSYKRIGRLLNVTSHKSVMELQMTDETPDKYQCIASNKYGKLKIFFNLQIGVRPEAPGSIKLTKANSDSLELAVEVPEPSAEAIDSGMDPRWLNIFYRNAENEDWDEQIFNITLETFILTELNSSTMYEIMAATRNVAGLSALSNTTFFQTTNASSVQINNLGNDLGLFNVILIYALIFLTSRLA